MSGAMRPGRADAVLCRLDEARRFLRKASRYARSGDWHAAEHTSYMASMAARKAEHLSMPGYVVRHTDVVVLARPGEPMWGVTSTLRCEDYSCSGDASSLRRGASIDSGCSSPVSGPRGS